jgi:hypothetical protein
MDNVTPIDAAKKPTAPPPKPLTDEAWREYEWSVLLDGKPGRVCYRINEPAALVVGNTTHRVIDSKGVVHCVPTVGERGCTLRWQPKPGAPAVAF